MGSKKILLLTFLCFSFYKMFAQCNTLRPQIDISFNTDQDCAPVTVTEFRVTYYFNVPQDPAAIQILYEWNDPANSTDVIGLVNGLVAGAGNTSFTANATFVYNDNNGQCSIMPTTYIIIGGEVCMTSAQTQTAFFWGTDEQANGNVRMAPPEWEVCYGNAVTNAIFQDDSEFNCNIAIEPDNPNRFARHVQFVYGTNHNPAATIRDLTLNDGAVRGLTDGAGNLVSTTTRGTGAVQVTGAYFGPVDAIPFPADGPVSATFPMNAPANAANAIGNRFEVTLYNWNICNPWNGDPVNPNYEDAVLTRGYIVIVEAPAPNFVTRDAAGNITTDFCIGEMIDFRNLTPNIANYTYTWQFYDDAAGTNLIRTSTQRHPQLAFSTGGTKLIRLRAQNPTAQSPCVEEYTALVNISPALVAEIRLTDLANNPITPDFCQEASPPLTTFDVRFTDASTGTITANTEWRWEFYDQNNTLVFSAPGSGYSSTVLGPFDRQFTTTGVYRVRLSIRDRITLCESSDEAFVRVFEGPEAAFSFDRVCLGSITTFADQSTLNTVNGGQIVSWEWDMDYDGTTFTPDAALNNQRNPTYTFTTTGNHTVALRVTTDQGCSSMTTNTVVVDPVPLATFTADRTSGCSTLTITFTNTAIGGQPDTISEYVWEVDNGSGFQVDSVQRPTDPGFGNLFTRDFLNNGSADLNYQVRLRVVTVNGCETVSNPVTITVNPGPRSGFVSLNYSPFDSNCSPVSVNFRVDSETQALNPSEYQWTISDVSGVIDQQSTGTTPSFTYNFVNSTQSIRDFFITLRAVLPSACYGDSTRTIRINPVPTSAFTIDTAAYDCEKMIIQLNATQKGLVEYRWSIAINGTPVYSSTTDGDSFEYEVMRANTVDQTVSVTLSTVNFANCPSTITSQSIVVPRNNGVNASFTATPLSQTLPSATVTITNNTAPGPWQYLWDFGDGITSTDPNVASHTYATYGTYPIRLKVSDGQCTAEQIVTVQINPIPPIIDFEYYPSSGCAPLTVNFVNKSQYADPGSYFWEFGINQGTSRAVNPVYTYFESGIYSVTLSATNALGDTVKVTKQMIIEVFESPTAQFAVYPREISVPGDIMYTNNQSFGASTYLWDFGDGTTSTETEPRHEYRKEGVFDITLVATNTSGCSDTAKLESAVKTVASGKLLIPNAFTPNRSGPGSTHLLGNEVFIPLMRNVVKFHMLVFNRWGELLFESSNPDQGWDGYYKGRLCQQDVYIYKITVEYEDGKTMTRTGDINLLR